MNKQSADMYALALAMELAKSSDTGFNSTIATASADYAKNLAAFISSLSAGIQSGTHEGIGLPDIQRLIKNSSAQ